MKLKLYVLCLIGFLGSFLFSNCTSHSEKMTRQFTTLKTQFLQTYPRLSIAPLARSYVDNLKSIPTLEQIQNQTVFFQQFTSQLSEIEADYLSTVLRMEYELLVYECRLHLERLALEKDFRENEAQRPIDEKGLYFNIGGKAWYAHFLKRWIGAEQSPEAIMAFGEVEIKKVQAKIQRIQQNMGYVKDSIGFYEHLN
ncbi:MAG: hypothetical protein AAGD05_03280, partial [Bacteroidota bacterium]